MMIKKYTLDFLKALASNNNREWFQENKERYLASQENMIEWLDTLLAQLSKHDQLKTANGKEALYRIYNDVRFSKDKAPYNPRFAGNIKRLKPFLRGGYYFWIKPGASRIGCGFTYPNAEDLLRIRQDIAINYEDWHMLLKNKKLKNTFGTLQGETVKTKPKGFSKDHVAIDLLRHKQFWFEKSYSDKEVLSKDFLKMVNNDFKVIRPFFDYMTEILTTNSNGESIL
ncbi:TIGR02453 family protein [Chryseotalea sanaruensis]|uniref:TIGR02453 family protein n=1 Tax=Chryseotalea sanaruensis TaxID=2482724 RepID=A0A401UCS2_9BACT|nr:DUF2461 domain-containing protein [Chryseotalea sanaruensis]GCC52662.1 TIGR02453 family protein [Chryseotalea sanaruensis]